MGDFFLVGIDGRNTPCVISKAYNDSDGLTDKFIMNGLDNINKVFGTNVFDRTQFEYLSIYNDVIGRHEAYYKSLCDQVITSGADSVEIKKDELINIEYSYKYELLSNVRYSNEEVMELAHDSKFLHIKQWQDKSGRYGLNLYQKPPFFFPKLTDPSRCPSIGEFHELWKAWFVLF